MRGVDRARILGDIGALEGVPEHGIKTAPSDQKRRDNSERAKAEIDVALQPGRQRH